MRTCPFCAEKIDEKSTVCRYCEKTVTPIVINQKIKTRGSVFLRNFFILYLALFTTTCLLVLSAILKPDSFVSDLLYKTKGFHGSVAQVKFSPDGKFFAGFLDNNTIHIWNASDGKWICSIDGGNRYSIMGFQFLSEENTIVLINLANSEYVMDYYHTDNCHLQRSNNPNIWWNASSLEVSPDDNLLITKQQGEYGGIYAEQIWNAKDLLLLHTLPINTYIKSTTLSIDGSTLAVWSADGWIYIWGIQDGELLNRILTENIDMNWIQFCVSPDGKTLAFVGYDVANIYNIETGELINTIDYGKGIEEIVFSSEGSMLATSSGKEIYLWRYTDGKLLKTYQSDETARVMSFSLDSKMLAVGLSDNNSYKTDKENTNIEVFTTNFQE